MGKSESGLTSSAVQLSSTEGSLLHITLCRYGSGQLIRQERSLSEEFIAISHVWNNADWLRVGSIEGEIIVLEGKARFIAKDLPALVGGSWFWVDILCVDQRNVDARVAVTQHIPSIFQATKKTIVIRESIGFRD
jgi:hypothetical protein